MLDAYGITEETWLEATKVQPHFAISETPHYVRRHHRLPLRLRSPRAG